MSYVLKTHLANKSNYGSKRALSSIKKIVIHYTSNDGDKDENNGKYFAGNVVSASAHYFVDSDSITQSVPDDYVAWSVGGKKYSNCNVTGGGKYYGIATNANTLNIEICDDVKNGVVYPSAATIQNAIEFTKVKMAQYSLSKEDVIRHFDVTGKSCPAYWVDDTKWRAEFWDKLSGGTTTVPSNNNTTTAVPFLIKVDKVKAGDVLNVRQEPNANAKITGKLAYNDPNTYTIVEVRNGWGLLKSKLGWINLNYTKSTSVTSKPSPAPTPAPAPQPMVQKSIDEWAKEVINGKHGSGHANREASLKKSGCTYPYEQVRVRVNALLGVKTNSATTPTKSLDAWAKEVINGKHGSGHANREASLKKAGCTYSYSQVRARVNALLK